MIGPVGAHGDLCSHPSKQRQRQYVNNVGSTALLIHFECKFTPLLSQPRSSCMFFTTCWSLKSCFDFTRCHRCSCGQIFVLAEPLRVWPCFFLLERILKSVARLFICFSEQQQQKKSVKETELRGCVSLSLQASPTYGSGSNTPLQQRCDTKSNDLFNKTQFNT